MSELGHRQPQSAIMTGPDGVVYAVTSAGAVPSAHATAPARYETTHGQEALRGQRQASSVVTWCFSYAADGTPGQYRPGVAGPCFSYSADGTAGQQRALPATTSCFSLSAAGTPGQRGPGEARPCFSCSPDAPADSTGYDASEVTDGLPAMPVSPCFSYSADLPGSVPAMPATTYCFSYFRAVHLPPGNRRATRRGMPGVRQMPEVGPCFSMDAVLPPGIGLPASKLCFSFDADLPPGIGNRRAARRGMPWVRQMPVVSPCFSYSADPPPGPSGLPGEVTPCFSYTPDLPMMPGQSAPCFSY
jgi:hypothetical protein